MPFEQPKQTNNSTTTTTITTTTKTAGGYAMVTNHYDQLLFI
jgi:hypothetical protein